MGPWFPDQGLNLGPLSGEHSLIRWTARRAPAINNLLIYFWLCWLSVSVCGLSPVAADRGYSPVEVLGFSLRRRLSLWSPGPGLHGLQDYSHGGQVQLLCGMWPLPRPGIKPMSPVLAGGFLTSEPPGKSNSKYFKSAFPKLLWPWNSFFTCRM